MNTKLISKSALNIVNQYANFQVEKAVCSIPYFNNKTTRTRAALKVEIGKGSPKDIYEEIEQIIIKQKINLNNLTSNDLKKLLIDNNIGIDCSGFVYYVLNEEIINRNKGTLDKHLHFPYAKGILGKLKAKIRPIENTDVATFTHNLNSINIQLLDAQPSDIITMINGGRDHILIINQIEYQNFIPTTLHYTHAIAWPNDGEYGHGIHLGKIEIININKPIIEQRWIENDKTGEENYTFLRAQKSLTELRRMSILC